MTRALVDDFARLVNSDDALVHRARWLTADMMLEIGDDRYLVKIREGRITSVDALPLLAMPYDFALSAPRDAWEEFWKPVPRPRHHDVMALIREGKMRITGNLELMMAHFLTLKLMLEKPRKRSRAAQSDR